MWECVREYVYNTYAVGRNDGRAECLQFLDCAFCDRFRAATATTTDGFWKSNCNRFLLLISITTRRTVTQLCSPGERVYGPTPKNHNLRLRRNEISHGIHSEKDMATTVNANDGPIVWEPLEFRSVADGPFDGQERSGGNRDVDRTVRVRVAPSASTRPQ